MRSAPWVAAVLCAALVTACSAEADEQVASAGSPSSSSSTGSSGTAGSDRSDLTRQQQGQQQVECLREHGLSVPDADKDGEVTYPGDEPGGTWEDKDFDAEAACRHLAPEPTEEEKAKRSPEAQKAFAACMRGKGVDWPDPEEDGSTKFSMDGLSEADAAAEQAAIEACGG
ncbi:hypothetical protein Sked_25320 [Sanguibacter keddieii DSM 10542]|uniref:Secreted protein n=1 Tax=Sanguibacter keddieii (strain ATCC 51767 / DSM 10542 / NCFB 3025 / ST-74) TaxID=446469 RepID=D1BK27_SANKS|nr:hypothetical protein Sked_25320 [Sanguibacter keddieii DSM 10542]